MYTIVFRAPFNHQTKWAHRIFNHSTCKASAWLSCTKPSLSANWRTSSYKHIIELYQNNNPSPLADKGRFYVIHTSDNPITLEEIKELYPEYFI